MACVFTRLSRMTFLHRILDQPAAKPTEVGGS
jgi:hypothetical protein